MMTKPKPKIGVLALQGDYERHEHQLGLVGVVSVQVRLPSDLEKLDGLIIPGGESTTMNYLIDRFGLRDPLLAFCRSHPVWGTCAGMIMLAKTIEDNPGGVQPFGLLDIDVVRNGYGRQVFSFSDRIEVNLNGTAESLDAIFIRAPRVTRVGANVTVLASYGDSAVLVRQGNLLASSFHTELEDDTRMLGYFLEFPATK